MVSKSLNSVKKEKASQVSDPLSPAESAAYTRAMLESLRKLAHGHGQSMLAHFLQIAALEADSQAKGGRG